MPTWREIVDEAIGTLTAAAVPDPDGSARWIGREATGTDGSEWSDVADRPATKRQLAAFDRMVARRCAGEPLQYVVGSWGFRTLDLFVDRRVLIPRPETEVVAGRAIDELDRLRGATVGEQGQRPIVADLGTGSGAIGLAVAAERPGTEVWLTDVSSDALAVARANLAGLGSLGGSVRLAEGRWFDALPPDLLGSLSVVAANPPYVASMDDVEPGVAAWEPEVALLADDDGRADLVHLVDRAPAWLTADGALVLEMDPTQVATIEALAQERFAEVDVIEDLVGRRRGVAARRPLR